MTASASPPPATRRAWGRIALVAALVLSLFLNAVALGAWLRFREARADLLGPEAAAARLPDELRQDLRAALRAEARSIRPLLRDVVQARAAIVAAANARPYIRSDAEAAMVNFRTSLDALLADVQRVFLDQLDDRSESEK
jgi:uncharacterized membrane protein